MKVYISGKITDNLHYKEDFARAEQFIKSKGYKPLNPAKIGLDLSYEEYMQLDFKLIEMADCIYMLKGWQDSKGATAELTYAKALNKKIKYEGKQWILKKALTSNQMYVILFIGYRLTPLCFLGKVFCRRKNLQNIFFCKNIDKL